MKVLLAILVYIFCPECRIEDGPIDKIEFEILGSRETDCKNKNHPPILLKDLNDYTNFYLDFYGTYPGYTNFDFNKNMIVVFFDSNTEVEDVYETSDQISIHLFHPKFDDQANIYPIIYLPVESKTYYTAVSIKQSTKTVNVYP